VAGEPISSNSASTRLGAGRMLGKPPFEFDECRDRLLGGRNGASIERLEIAARPSRRSVQEVTHNEAEYKRDA